MSSSCKPSNLLATRLSSLTFTKTEQPDDDWIGPLGLNLLYEPAHPLIDIILVHGLAGGSRKTWSRTHDLADFWPQEWLPKEPRFENVRIHSFGYPANWRDRQPSTLTVHDFGHSLISDMEASPSIGQGCSNTSIILLGHSMGGLVIKKVLLLAKQDPGYRQIAERIQALFFLGTPHRGADMAIFLSNVLKLTTPTSIIPGSKAYVHSLIPNSEAMHATNDQFRHAYEGVQLYSYFETLPTSVGLIVEKSSAILELPGEKISNLNADHGHISKFTSRSDPNYCRLRDALTSEINRIEKHQVTPLVRQLQEQMEKLSLYLGIAENPNLDLQDAVERRTEGSCSWITSREQFLDWQHGLNNAPPCYWLRGEPASGKSTITGHVIQSLLETKSGCSFFFFRDRNSKKSTASDLLCSLAWQMACSNEPIRQSLLEMCDGGIKLDRKDDRAVWRTMFVSRILRAELDCPQYWVIDAVDECPNYGVLFNTVLKFTDSTFPLRIFLTSRPEMPIERYFARENIPRTMEAITLQESLGDIRLYLEEHARFFIADSEHERKELVQTIWKKSNGNFLWTSLVVKRIEEAYTKHQIHEILHSVPERMNEFYSYTWRNVLADDSKKRIARAMLRWTLCSMRPLHVDELNEALRLDIGETVADLRKTAGSVCGHLLYVDAESRVQAAHQTVRAFFLKESDKHLDDLDKRQANFAMDRDVEHTAIGDVCLRYLSSPEMKPPRFRRSSVNNPQKGPHRAPQKGERSAFSSYGITHFSAHIARGRLPNDNQLESINHFVTTNSLSWVESIARTRNLGPIIQTAKDIKAYLERRVKHEAPLSFMARDLMQWANDLIYLVAQFGNTLLYKPDAILHLIPAVCPRKSMIFRTLKSRQRGLRVVGLFQDEWDERLCCVSLPGVQIISVASQDNMFALGTSIKTDGNVHLYQETTFQEQKMLPHGEPVRRLRFSATSRYLVSAGLRTMKLWDTTTGFPLWSVKMREEPLAVDFDSPGKTLYAVTKGNNVIMWDAISGNETKRFAIYDWDEEERGPHHFRRSPTHADFSVGLGSLGVAYRTRPVSFWNLEDQEFDGQYHRSRAVYPEPFIHAFIFNPNPEVNLAAVSYQDGLTVVFDPESQTMQAKADTGATILAASPDGTVLAAGTGEGIVKLYDFEKMQPLHQFFLHQQSIRSMSFNSDGSRLFEVRGDSCNIWEPSVLVRRNHGEDDSISDDSDLVLQPVEMSSVSTHDEQLEISALALHHDGDVVFCGREDGSVAAYSTLSGMVLQELFKQSPNVAIDILEWSQQQHMLVSADRSGRYTLRTLEQSPSGQFIIGNVKLDEDPECVLHQALLSNNSDRLLVSTSNCDILWDLSTGSVVKQYDIVGARDNWKWASDTASGRSYLFENGLLRVFSWTTFEEMSPVGGLDLGTTDYAVNKVFFPIQHSHVCLIISETLGAQMLILIRLFPWKEFHLVKPLAPLVTELDKLSKEIKVVVGTYKSWLVFLQHSGWLCSVNIETASAKHYVRHCFIPQHWHCLVSDIYTAVTHKGSIIVSVKDKVVVIHNALDFDENVVFGT